MSTSELERQNELADALIAKLEQIKALWEELPGEDQLEELRKSADAIAARLDEAAGTFQADDFPTADDLEPILRSAADLAANLNEAAEAQATVEE